MTRQRLTVYVVDRDFVGNLHSLGFCRSIPEHSTMCRTDALFGHGLQQKYEA